MESISVPIDWVPWCINTGKSLIPLTLRFLAQKRNLLIPLELSRVMHQGSPAARNTLDSARIPRASKLLICGLFQKGRVLAQDGVADGAVRSYPVWASSHQ